MQLDENQYMARLKYSDGKRKNWQTIWFATKEECHAHIADRAKSAKCWGVELLKVNKSNKTYTHGYTVRWYEVAK